MSAAGLYRNLLCLLLTLAGLTADAFAFYPGFLSPDSLDQYAQALHNSYSDWHPPVMAALWHLLLPLYNGPQPMFFLQLLLLWTSFYLLMRFFMQRYGYLSILVILFFSAPFVQNFIGVVWKDVQMATSWLLASAIMIPVFFAKRKLQAWEAVLVLLLITYGCWVRPNAFAGIIPLVALWLMLLSNSTVNGRKAWLLLSGKTMAVTLLIILAHTGMSRLLRTGRTYIEFKLFAHDLSGIYYKTGEVCFPEFVQQHPGFDTAYIRTHYQYATFDNIWWNSDGKNILPNVNAEQLNEVRNAWIKAIATHPIAYFKNRANGFLFFLRIRNSGSSLMTLYPYIHPNSYGFKVTPNAFSAFVLDKIRLRTGDVYMTPWFWCLVNLLLLAAAFLKPLRQIRPVILALSLSSLFYILLEFVVFPADTEFRYFYWNCLSLTLAFLLAVAELGVGNRRSSAPSQSR